MCMRIHTAQADKAPAAIGPYLQAIAAGPFLFVRTGISRLH
jgi:hypothetical protein